MENPVWRPSLARVLTASQGAETMGWPAKEPADILDYYLDWKAVLIGGAGNEIAAIGVTISPVEMGGLLLVSAAADGSRVVLWLQGGQVGTTYAVTLTLGTQAGRDLAWTVSLPVKRHGAPDTP